VCKYKLQQNRYICRCGVQDLLQWVPVTAVHGLVGMVGMEVCADKMVYGWVYSMVWVIRGRMGYRSIRGV
jgi:hypothetical protein